MRASVSLGRIAGVAVAAHWSLLLVAALLTWSLAVVTLPEAAPGQPAVSYWVVAALTAVAFLGAVLAHEVGHAVMARHHGVVVEDITLWVLGGVARLRGEPPSADAELRIALAGPAVSMLLAIASLVVGLALDGLGGPALISGALLWFALVNGVLAVFNLLPAAPLDGGRVLTAIVWRRTGDAVLARRRAARAGRAFGWVLVGLGFLQVFAGLASGLWMAAIGWFVLVAARAEEEGATMRATLTGVTAGEVCVPAVCVPAHWTLAQVVEHLVGSVVAPAYPVVDPVGRPLGVLTLRRLRELPAAEWLATPAVDAAEPVPPGAVIHGGTSLLAALEEGAGPPFVVVDVLGRVEGIVTTTELASAIERFGLRRRLATGGATLRER